MNKKILAIALLLPSLSLAQLPTKEPAKAAPKEAASPTATGPVATVNGVQIPRQRADAFVRLQTARGAQDSEQLRAQVRELLINNELLVQEANRSGLAKKADVQQQIELNRLEIVANAVIAEFLRTNPVSDADVQKEYDRARAQTGDREYKARHILVATEDDAKSVLADLKKGTKFDEIAQKRSLDEGTRPKGGDLDWQSPGTFDKDFANAMVKLSKGRYTETPVKTRFGFHVIQLEDSRAAQHPPLTEVKGQISQRLQRAKVESVVAELRAKAKVE